MEKTKIIIIVLIIAISTLVIVPTISKINNNNIDKAYLVASKKIIEKAETCYYEKKCLDKKIFIKDIIKKGYIEKTINPKTEEYFSNDAYVLIGETSKLYVN